jgi:RNA polymerase sigma-70 factor (sigma-E family)
MNAVALGSVPGRTATIWPWRRRARFRPAFGVVATEVSSDELGDSGFNRLDPIGGDTGLGHPVANGTRQGASLTELYYAHRLALVRLAVLLVDDQQSAEDVVQDAFTGLWQRHGDRPRIDNPLGYLRTAVVNNARSVLRRRQTARRYVPPHQPYAGSAEAEAMLSAEHRAVVDALRQLTDRQREVLVMRYWSDLSEADIAETLGISKGTVKSTASRAIDALGKLLA